MKTYLELVNEAISEAKVTLDPLTAANFANPPRTILYNKFKDWVNRAYREVLLKRNEWHFQMERAISTVGPRIHVISTGYIPQVGDVIRGQTSQFEVPITGVNTFEDDLVNPGINEYTLDVTFSDGHRVADFAIQEFIDIISPTPTSNALIFQGPGLYQAITPMFRVDRWKATIFDSIDQITAPGTNSASATPLIAVPWDHWTSVQFDWSSSGSKPQYVTQNPMGLFDLYPKPDIVYPLEVFYTRGGQDLVNFDDVPLGFPEIYQDYIMWKAVEEFADYDQNTRLFSRANKKVEWYESLLERDEMPTVAFERSRFDRNNIRRWYP